MLFRSEFKYLAAPITITTKSAKSGHFQIFNKQFFRDLRDYKLRYEVTVNGKVQTTGDVKLPAVKPRKSAVFSIPASALKNGNLVGERFVNFSISLAVGTPWAHPNFEVGWEQFALPAKPLPKARASKKPERYVNEKGEILLPFTEAAPKLTLWRAANDNDRLEIGRAHV